MKKNIILYLLVILPFFIFSCNKTQESYNKKSNLTTFSQMTFNVNNIDLPANSIILFHDNHNNQVGHINPNGEFVFNTMNFPNYISEDSTEYYVSEISITKDLELGTFHYLKLVFVDIINPGKFFTGAIFLDVKLSNNGGFNNINNNCNIDVQTVSTTNSCKSSDTLIYSCDCCDFTYHACGEIKGCKCCETGRCNHEKSHTSKFFTYVSSLTI